MENKRVDIMGIQVDALTMDETINHVNRIINSGKSVQHICINAAKITQMHKDPKLCKIVMDTEMISADGQSIVWLSRLCRKERRLPERVAGIDLMERLVALAHERGYKIFFFGAKEDIVKKVVNFYSSKYSTEIIAGYRNGYYKPEEERGIAEHIASSGANILFIAMSSPMKETFLRKHREILNAVNFSMGVGGSFDVVSGLVRRAPILLQELGFEWLYRFLQEPTRLGKRYFLNNTQFLWLALRWLVSRNFSLKGDDNEQYSAI